MSYEVENIQSTEQQEPLFENAFTATEEVYRDYAKLSVSRAYKNIHVLVGAIFTLFFVFLIFARSHGFQNDMIPLLIVVAPLCAIHAFLSPKIKATKLFKHALKRENVLHAGKENSFSWHEAKFYKDVIMVGDVKFKYSQISKILTSNSCLYILIQETFVITIKKDAFTVGDYESFIVFLKEKLTDNPVALLGLLEGVK